MLYALLTNIKLNIGVIVKSMIWKAQVRKGHMHAFVGFISKMYCRTSVNGKFLGYMALMYPIILDIICTKGSNNYLGPILSTFKRNKMDELMMARMFGLEMFRYITSGRPYTCREIG